MGELALNCWPAGFLAFDDNSVVVEANKTLCDWLGFDQGELADKRLEILMHGGGHLYFQSQVFPLLQLRGQLEEVYLMLYTKQGAALPVLVSAKRRHRSGGGAYINEMAIMRMSQRAHLEDELLEAKKRAEEASDAKSKFLALMSHELRTPLQTIAFSTAIMLDDEVGSITSKQRELLETTKLANAELVRLIEDILNYARMKGGEVEVRPVDCPVEEALLRAEVLMRPRLEQGGVLYERGPIPEGLVARADPNRLQQILLNLLGNASKFTPRGGRITASATRSGDVIRIEISDTGKGIPEEQFGRIFEAFVQLRERSEANQGDGLGLGLAICRQLSRAMGGDIRVRSAVGSGSTFSVSLPMAVKQPTNLETNLQ